MEDREGSRIEEGFVIGNRVHGNIISVPLIPRADFIFMRHRSPLQKDEIEPTRTVRVLHQDNDCSFYATSPATEKNRVESIVCKITHREFRFIGIASKRSRRFEVPQLFCTSSLCTVGILIFLRRKTRLNIKYFVKMEQQ